MKVLIICAILAVVIGGALGALIAVSDDETTPIQPIGQPLDESGIQVVGKRSIGGDTVYRVIVEREGIDLTCLLWNGYQSGSVSCVEGR